MVRIISLSELLQMNLNIPDYQRPYKWESKNVSDLLKDIDHALEEAQRFNNYKYRFGSIILHKNENLYDIVDGQQRLLSLLLIRLALEPEYNCSLIGIQFSEPVTKYNIHSNALYVQDYFSLRDDSYKQAIKRAFSDIFEVVIITVSNTAEAFQLFDSQNTRGKPLDPRDLLKAYHLRAMREFPYEMQHAVSKWEAADGKKINDLFSVYLFPALKWMHGENAVAFSSKYIDSYKGIPANTQYTYAKRATNAMPYFQVNEPFIEGRDFFEMVNHYLELVDDLKCEITGDDTLFPEIQQIITKNEYCESTGFKYAANLFYCVLLSYYDRFHNFDAKTVIKLFTWAMMIRVDLETLGFDSINKYALGVPNDKYTNAIAVFRSISNARLHSDISDIQIKVRRKTDEAKAGKWTGLYQELLRLNHMEA